MVKIFKYSFLTCTLGYLLAAILYLILIEYQIGKIIIDSDVMRALADYLTIGLSELSGWGDYYFLAILIPWFVSTVLMTIFISIFKEKVKNWRIFGGLSLLAYNLTMLFVLIISGFAGDWNQDNYEFLIFLVIVTFGLGYLAAILIEKYPGFNIAK